MKEDYRIIAMLLVIPLAVIIAAIGSWLDHPNSVTRERMRTALAEVSKMDSPPPEMDLDITDYWERPLKFKFTKSEKQLVYQVTSMGADGKIGTSDDIYLEHIDRNIARAVGAWSAEKAKEFLKGIREGVSHKSKYE